MPKCKRCGNFGTNVCHVDTEYEESVRKEMEDLAETRIQVSGVIRRINNWRRVNGRTKSEGWEEEQEVREEQGILSEISAVGAASEK